MAEFTLDEAYTAPQGGHAFGLDEAYAAPKQKLQVIEPERESNAELAVKGTLGSIAGAAGQVSDMFTGILAGIARVPTYVGARTSALAQTGDQKLSAQAAAIGAEEVLPEAIHAPFRSIAKSLGPEAERYYNQNPVGWINEKISEFITEGGIKGEKGTGIPSEDIMQGIDALMTVAGIKGTKLALKDAIIKRDGVKAATLVKQAQEELAAKQRAKQEEEFPTDPVAAAAKRRLELSREALHQQYRDVLAVKTPEQRVAEQKAKRSDVKAAFKRPEEGSDYVDIDESIFRADERTRQSAAYERTTEQPDTSTVYDTTKPAAESSQRPFLPIEELSEAGKFREGARILQTPPHERTALDLARLRRLREGGSASPELLGLLGVAGLGATAGAALSDDALRGAGVGAAAGAAAALPFMGRGAGVRQRMGQTGAVKGPGGMWHPEAVERLHRSLVGDDTEFRYVQEGRDDMLTPGAKPFVEQSERMIKNYLNKHAGTPTDPLKDIKIPFGEGTKRWEELTDKTFLKGTLGEVSAALLDDKTIEAFKSGKIKTDETVWRFTDQGLNSEDYSAVQPRRAIESYLSHVGDYLRQNVDPAKLSQYDLVRAVKETAANDARVAKEIAKAASDTTKQLPVYKAYPDGFKWVELKEPESLTPEQAKYVKEQKVTKEDIYSGKLPEEAVEGEVYYVAVDAQGKPIVNSYTQEKAHGPTPQRAFLAGRLAEEGNQMGHCVGGYCEGVASGESKIYSLRGPDGKSHVTIEVSGSPDVRVPTNSPEYFARVTGGELLKKWNEIKDSGDWNAEIKFNREIIQSPEYQTWLKEQPADIQQIKGKQNRAPNAEYLPYVQDFVKGGKWGDVGDLGNTGLIKRSSVLTPAEKANLVAQGRDVPEFLTPEDLKQLQALPRNSAQSGQINQQLLTGLGAIGLGSLVGSYLAEEPGTGALWGALAGGVLGIPGARARAKEVVQGADYLAGVLSTRIKNISPEIMHRAREFERLNMQRSHDLLNRAVPWMKALNELPKEVKAALSRAVLTNDAKAVAELQKGHPELVSGWREVRNILTQLGTELGNYGRFRSMREDYFPRLVKDYEGLMGALDQTIRTKLEQVIADGDAKAMATRGAPLSDIEKSAIINRELSIQRRAQGHQPGYAKQRTVKDITEQLEPFYHTPEESLFAYVRGAVADIEMARFFGKDLVQITKEGQNYTNIDQSVGNIVGRLLKEGKLDPSQQRQLEDLLKARFKSGERSPNKTIQDVRNLVNAGLLGNAISAATQLGDVAMPIYAQGLRATMTAMARQLTGNAKVTAKDFGLADHLAEEFVGASRTAEALNKIFKYSGFSMVDRFGKNTMLNAALSKYERLSRSTEGNKQIAQKYQALFGDQLPQVINDLRGGQVTPNVRALLFSELSDFQPISKLEVPQGYLDHPNGRVMYMLKTFMIKQFDVVRRDAYNEIKTGNRAKGIKNLTAYAATLGLAGATADMVKDWLMGRPISFEAGDIMENVLKTFGWSEYVRDKAKKEPTKAIINSVLPPFQMMDQILTTDPKAVQYIPIIGKLYYNWELGGKEDAEIRDWQKAKKQGVEKELSMAAEERRRQKREEARAKREKEKQ